MDIWELTITLGGEVGGNEARIKRDNRWLTLAKIIDNRLVLTHEGEVLLADANTPVIPSEPVLVSEESKPVLRRGRSRKPDVDTL